MSIVNRQWLLACRPHGTLSLDSFAYREVTTERPVLEDRQIFVRNLMFACPPTLRNWINDASRSYRASAPIGQPIACMAAVEVVDSRHADYPAGMRLIAVSGWEDYRVLSPDAMATPLLVIDPSLSLTDAMGIYGVNSLTAYFGMLRVARPRSGETVVVSGAAGSTGSIAAQIARIIGCRVIGIAGGQAKCDWLREVCRLDHAIDYKAEDVAASLARLCPEGVDVFYDNVGGPILQAVMDNIARKGRIAVCGQISAYDGDTPAPGPRDMMKLVYWSVRIEGFLLGDHMAEASVALKDLSRWNAAGELAHREDVRDGMETLPAAFLDLFRGANEGTLLVRIADHA